MALAVRTRLQLLMRERAQSLCVQPTLCANNMQYVLLTECRR
jgi:hypothetical protein